MEIGGKVMFKETNAEQEMITITKEEYDRLTNRDNLLECLNICGVDTWDGWQKVERMFASQMED